MARFLTRRRGKLRLAVLLLPAGLIITLLAVRHVYAASAYGHFTGYAMGNRYGAFGVEVTYGDFANHHSSTSCYEGWPYNTRIQTPQSVQFHNPGGTVMYYSTFYLRDRGDLTCAMPKYWVDLYFGRSQYIGQPCNCPGSPSPGYCIYAYWNNCTDAINFGWRDWTYTYTFP